MPSAQDIVEAAGLCADDGAVQIALMYCSAFLARHGMVGIIEIGPAIAIRLQHRHDGSIGARFKFRVHNGFILTES